MKSPKASDVKKGISGLWETLQCPICLDLLSVPVSTKCDHQFCKFCIMKLVDNSKQKKTCCPVCKTKITKRGLHASPGFQSLVAGLQDMIQAYEHDTGTNYFTGMSLHKKQPSVTDGEASEHPHDMSSGKTSDSRLENMENVDEDLPRSRSSTVAAQSGFAKLMGLDDSSPLTTENLDSGLGDAPPTSDKKPHSPTDDLEPEEAEMSTHYSRSKKGANELESASHPPSQTPDETDCQPLRKSSRRKHKKDPDSDKILDQKRKKSMEKVAEWLMKVPVEGSPELEKPDDDDDSYSCSSTSTIDVKQHLRDLDSKREDRAKSLEEHVFGAVYKRDRTGKRNSSRHDSAEPTTIEQETGAEETQVLSEDGNDNRNDRLNEAEQMEESDAERDSDPADPESEPQPPVRKSKRRMQSAQQQLDSDFNEQVEAKTGGDESKKTDRRKGRSTKSEKNGNPTRVSKPLVLVGVQNGETTPVKRVRPEEVQVQIENYPSSEDHESPVVMSTRRSRRLQLFVDEVQGGLKKADVAKSSAAERDVNVTKQSGEVKGDVGDEMEIPKNGNVTKTTKRNGCVCDGDLGGIENIDFGVRAQEKESVAVTVVPNSTEGTVLGPTLESDNPTAESSKNMEAEASVCESKCAEVEKEEEEVEEEEKDDSEVDTEQLLQSFKATKRKSFHLGGPKAKRSRSSEPGKTQGAETEEEKDVGIRSAEKRTSDPVSPSISPILERRRPDRVVAETSNPIGRSSGRDCAADDNPLCRSTQSSVLTPNQVTIQCETESSHPSLVPQLVDSGLRLTGAVDKSSRSPSSRLGCSATDGGRSEERNGDAKQLDKAAERTSVAESSLCSGSAELSAQSSVNPRRKRRTQRLESESESDSTGSVEDLPTLTQILGRSARPAAVTRDPEDSNEADGCEEAACAPAEAGEELKHPPACPSPDVVGSSQASVDLFGTPDECDVPVNDNTLSMESSQFSSEVLVTQQKVQMQKELVRLEKLMALVTEVLHEKEQSPEKETKKSGKATGPDAHRPLPCNQDQQQQESDQEGVLDAEQGASDGREVSESSGSQHGGAPEMTVQHSTHTAQSVNGIAASKTSASNSTTRTTRKPSDEQEDKENATPPKDRSKTKLVMVSSGLGPNEQITVKKFAKRVGARVVSQVIPEVTHVIMRTDEQLVCERTLKYFLGIAGRKWVVSFQWISECFKQKKLLDESLFEVKGDVVNGPDHQGPSRARTTADSNLLMSGYSVCFQGPFTDMTTDEMEWMVELCGADVVKDPLQLDTKQRSRQLVIVQPVPGKSTSASSRLARRATVVTRGWLLDTVATYTLQNLNNYLL